MIELIQKILKYPLQGYDMPFCTAVLPLSPSVNGSYEIVSVTAKPKYENGHLVYPTTADGRRKRVNRLGATEELQNFKETAAWLLKQNKAVKDWSQIEAIKNAKVKTPLRVIVHFYFPTLWKRDVDGEVKAVVDAVFKHMGLNDVLITQLLVEKFADANEPRVEIEVSYVIGK